MTTNLRRAGIALAAVLALVTLSLGIVFAANGSTALSQCANGQLSAPTDCTNNWVNGNLNQAKSHYREGDSIPYKVQFDNLTAVQIYSMTIGWDVIHSSVHALDYLTTWNRTVGGDPCSSIDPVAASVCAGGAVTITIPADAVAPHPGCSTATTGSAQIPGVFTLYGGTAFQTTSAYLITNCALLVGSTVQNQITLQFTASGTQALVLWGGHIATATDWGQGNSAGGISGSPYHTAQVLCSGNLNGCGQQDAQLAAAAVGVATPFTQRTPPGGIIET